MRKNNLTIGALTAIVALSLTGCQFSGGSTQVTDDNGACTQITVPSVNVAPVTAPTTLPGVVLAPCPATPPPTTTPPPPTSDVTATATVLNDHQVRIDWTTTRTDITGWTIGRDGTDSGGSGPWSTDLPAATRTLTFDLLVPGTLYHFTLTGHTAAANLTPVVVTATPTGTPPPTTTTAAPPPTTTQAPPPPTGATAAANFNWGTPQPQSDEFNYTGAPDTTKWDVAGECWPGHAGNGQRCASRSTVANGYLRETGLSNGDTGWLASNLNLTTGRWEVRARMAADGGTGHPYHPVLITWPQSDEWPQGGEYDFMETDIGAPGVDAFMHHPTQSQVVQDHYSKTVDITQWHNYGFEWSTSGLTGYIDGVAWFHDTAAGVQAPGPMHLTIQLDNFFGSGMQPAHFDVDWAHIYKF